MRDADSGLWGFHLLRGSCRGLWGFYLLRGSGWRFWGFDLLCGAGRRLWDFDLLRGPGRGLWNFDLLRGTRWRCRGRRRWRRDYSRGRRRSFKTHQFCLVRWALVTGGGPGWVAHIFFTALRTYQDQLRRGCAHPNASLPIMIFRGKTAYTKIAGLRREILAQSGLDSGQS